MNEIFFLNFIFKNNNSSFYTLRLKKQTGAKTKLYIFLPIEDLLHLH